MYILLNAGRVPKRDLDALLLLAPPGTLVNITTVVPSQNMGVLAKALKFTPHVVLPTRNIAEIETRGHEMILTLTLT